LTLNTYAKYLGYFTLKPRQRLIKNDVITIEFPKAATLIAGRVWVGYDEGSRFEAALSIWLQPKVNSLRRYLRALVRSLKRLPPETPATPYRYDSCSDEADADIADLPVGAVPPKDPGSAFSGNVYIGGVYMHRHTSLTSQQDYYPLNELHALKPIRVNSGSRIIINRDIFNIDQTKTFNAWDCEGILVVDE
jgi:hypothetical protein